MDRLTSNLSTTALAEQRMARYAKNTDPNVTTLIAEPAYYENGMPIQKDDNGFKYEIYKTDLTADAFSQMEADGRRRMDPTQTGVNILSSGYDVRHHSRDPGQLYPEHIWGASYLGGNSIAAVANGIQVLMPRFDLALIHSLLLTNPWHFACVDAKASTATQMGYRIESAHKTQKNVSNAEIKKFQAFEDRVYAKTGYTIAEIFKQISQDYFSVANMNLEITRNLRGEVDCIYPVPAVTCYKHATMPLLVQRLNPTEFTHIPLAEEVVVIPRFMSGIKKEDYVHLLPAKFKGRAGYHEMVMISDIMLSTDPFYGTPAILAAMTTLLGDNAANTYNLQFFRNNAVPRFAITVSGGRVTQAFIDKVQNFLSTEVKSQGHRSIVLPVYRGFEVEFHKLDDRPNEASFLAYKNFNREEIMAVHKVPPAEISVWGDANRSNAEQQSKNYLLKVIDPHQTKLEQIMNNILRVGLGLSNTCFRLNKIELTSEKELAQIRQINAIARVSETTAIRQLIDSIANATEAQILPQAEAEEMIRQQWARYEQLAENIDTTEI